MRGAIPILQPIKFGHTTGVYDPYSFQIVMWVLLRSTRTNQWKCCETGPTVFRPYPRRLESLTICRCRYWKTELSSQLFKDSECWSGRGLNPRPPARQTGALATDLTRRRLKCRSRWKWWIGSSYLVCFFRSVWLGKKIPFLVQIIGCFEKPKVGGISEFYWNIIYRLQTSDVCGWQTHSFLRQFNHFLLLWGQTEWIIVQ